MLDKFRGQKKIVNILYRYLTEEHYLMYDYYVKWVKNFPEARFEEYLKFIENVTKITICVKLRSFQYRVLTHALITNVQLEYYRIRQNNRCSFCDIEKETVWHLFFDCGKIQDVRKYIEGLICTRLTYRKVIFNDVRDNAKRVENMIVLLYKYYIYRARCMNVVISVPSCCEYVKSYETIEKEIAKTKGKQKQHEIKWSHIKL